MAYKAKIGSFRRKGDRLLLTINYKEGQKESSEELVFETAPSEEYLGRIAASRIEKLKSLDTFEASLAEGQAITPIAPDPTPTPEEPPTPTPAQEKRRLYRDAKSKLSEVKANLELGLITEEEYTIEKEKVKSLGKDAGEL